MRAMRVSLALGATLCALACNNLPGHTQAGTFSVRFSWATPPASSFSGWAYMRVESRPGDPNTAGKTVGTSGPVQFAPGLPMPFRAIPNQANLVLVVELRDIQSLDGHVLYYGVSQPFALAAGKNVEVPVNLAVLATPAANPVQQGTPMDALSVITANGAGVVNSPNIVLRVASDRGVQVQVSNLLGFPPAATQAVRLGSLQPAADSSADLPTYALPWSLAFGSAAPACSQARGCAYTVYAQLVDVNGYTSDTASTAVIYDPLAPAVQADASTVTPSVANAIAAVVVNLVASEVLASAPQLRVGGQDGLFDLVSQDSNTTFSYVSHAAAGSLWADGSYTVTASMVDLAGNSTAAAAVGAFTVDSILPGVSASQLTPPSPQGRRQPAHCLHRDQGPVAGAQRARGGHPGERLQREPRRFLPMHPYCQRQRDQRPQTGHRAAHRCGAKLGHGDPGQRDLRCNAARPGLCFGGAQSSGGQRQCFGLADF